MSNRESSQIESVKNYHISTKTSEEWLREGICHYNAHCYDEALLACEQAIKFKENCARAYYGKGLVLSKLQNFEEALVAYERAIQIDSSYVKPYNGKGNALYKLKRYSEALVVYEQAISIFNDYAFAYFGKGNTLLELSRYEEALSAYEEAIRLNSEYPAFYCKKGEALFLTDRLEDALTVLDYAILLAPYELAAYSSKAMVLEYLGRVEDANAVYDQFICINPNNAEAYERKGSLIWVHEQDSKAALDAFDRAILVNSLSGFALTYKASILFETGQFEKSVLAYDQVIRLDPKTPKYHFMRGQALLNLNRYEEAVVSFNQVIQCEEAVANSEEIFQMRPYDIETQFKKGQALFGCGRYDEALAAFKRTLTLFNYTTELNSYSNGSIDIGRVYSNACKLFSSQGNTQAAHEDLKQCYARVLQDQERAYKRMMHSDEDDDHYDFESDFTLLEPWESADDLPYRDPELELGEIIHWAEDGWADY